MLNIMHLTTVHPRYDTRIFLKECLSLAQDGCRVQLVVADGRGDEFRGGVEVVDLGIVSGHRLSRMLVNLVRVFFRIKQSNADIFHIHDPELLLIVLPLKLYQKRFIYDMHENLPLQIYSKGWLPKFLKPLISSAARVFERAVLNKIEVVMAESSYLSSYPFVKRATVVQNFPDISKIPIINSSKYEVFTVGYVGGVSKIRGVIDVLIALERMREDGHKICFCCLGPISSEVGADEHFQSALRQGWLKAPGRVDAPECWMIMSRCHVGMAMLHPHSNYQESWPTKMFEYMALSLPVIVSEFPMYREVIDKNKCGIVVPPANIELIKTAISYIKSNKAEATMMGINGRNAVSREYSWGAEFLNLKKLYNKT